MTRINLIPPAELTRNHLIAEYRELPSVFAGVHKAQAKGETPSSIARRAPVAYTLGTGHMLFFYTRLAWLCARYEALVHEMIKRNYKPNYPNLTNKIEGLDSEWFGDWEPSSADVAVSRERIEERLASRMTYKNKPGKRKASSTKQEWDF